jgi:hypothetical protein
MLRSFSAKGLSIVTVMEIVVVQNGTSLWTRVVSSAPTLIACNAWTSDIDIEISLC